MKWLITNIEIKSNLPLAIKTDSFFLYCSDLNGVFHSQSNCIKSIIIDGYVLPRNHCFEKYCNYSQYELVEKLFVEYGENIVKYIKGVFNLVITTKDSFYLFNDYLSIKKFFYSKNGNSFIISNNLELIKQNIDTKVDINQIAISALFHHYLYGKTVFKNIEYSLPAQKIVNKDKLVIDIYWNFDSLIKDKVTDISPEEYADDFSNIIKKHIEYLNPKYISQTLTGGLDSRTILSAQLKNKIYPRTYTYGNPESRDVVYAQNVAKEAKLYYKNHFPKLSSIWFTEYADKIIKEGNSLCSIHRAHRLDCIMNSIASDDEMLIGGYMGNETIRGLSYDDLIISKFLRKWWTTDIDKKELIRETLKEYFFDVDKFDIDAIHEQIMSFNFIRNEPLLNHFYATFEIKAANHHYQDPYLFSNHIKYPLPIFMDIDLLEIIFSSRRNILFMKKNESFIDKVKSHEFNLKIISYLAPELNHIPFGKNGYYTINEYNSNKILLYLKRFYRQKTEKKFPANFVLGDWLKEFLKDSMDSIKNNQIVCEIIEFEKLKNAIEYEKSTNEKDLFKYTNIISLSKIVR